MFEISVEREFCAAHALVIKGEREPLHGHNFHLAVTVADDSLDGDGLVIDFHALEGLVDGVIAAFVNQDLGAVRPFNLVNPSAERIAEHIASRVAEGLGTIASRASARLSSVRLTEAPGCSVTYRP